MPKKINKESVETAIILPDEAKAVISIKIPEDMTRATSVLSTLNKALDHLTEQKELLTKPLNQTLKEIRSRYKPYETKLEDKIAEIRQEMTQYQTRIMQIQAKKEQDLADKVASGQISLEKASEKLGNLPAIQINTETEAGSVKFKPVKKFEVISLQDLPLEYHLANEVKIRADMTAGKEIAGVRYFVEQVPYNSR